MIASATAITVSPTIATAMKYPAIPAMIGLTCGVLGLRWNGIICADMTGASRDFWNFTDKFLLRGKVPKLGLPSGKAQVTPHRCWAWIMPTFATLSYSYDY